MTASSFSINLYRYEDLETIFDSGIANEIVIHTQKFSKRGQIHFSDVESLVKNALEKQIKPVFQWDLIENQAGLKQKIESYNVKYGSALEIRFLDPGVGLGLCSVNSGIKIQQILDKTAYNLLSILEWEKVFGESLTRFLLSNEIPLNRIEIISKAVNCDIEVQVAGPIETFYSPRPLITSKTDEQSIYQTFLIESEDRPGSWLTAEQTDHGTLISHERDLMLLGNIEELIRAGVKHFLIDCVNEKQLRVIEAASKSTDWKLYLQENWPAKTTRGFFRSNKTDAPFKRLTNPFLQQKNHKIGEVLEYQKPDHLVIEFLLPLTLPIRVRILSPEGKEVDYRLTEAESLKDHERITELITPGIYKTKWAKHAVPTSVVLER